MALAMNAADTLSRILRPTKLKFLLLCVSVVLGTYLVGFWSVTLRSRTVNGNKRYRVVASFNWHDSADADSKGGTFNMTPKPPAVVKNVSSVYQKNETAYRTTRGPFNVLSSDKSDVLIPPVTTHRDYSCKKLIDGDEFEQQKVLQNSAKQTAIIQPGEYIKMTRDCQQFQQTRAYTMYPLTEEEAEFPIAYSILMFKDVEMFERLLRAIYRPQNYYCIHVDAKSSSEIKQAVEGITSCFSNVFMASRLVDVQWAYYSVLEPEILCMEQLWAYKKWKYFINLTGQEFPLKTNGELVKILKVLNGANNMEGTVKRRNRERTIFVHNGYWPTKVKKSPVPVPVTFTKGSVHIIAQRGFVDFVLHNKVALEFREWIKDTGVPDETFFTSLNYSPNLGAPGAYLGEPETDKIDPPPPQFPVNPFIARFKNWGDGPFNWPCGGQRVRMVCIFGVKDLPMLASRYELFANKFYSDYQPQTYDCVEELHYNRTRHELDHGPSIDLSFYEKLDIVKKHVE